MKVILKEDVEKLGEKGEIVEVANGYGRNYLIPRRKAVVATDGNVKQLEEEKRQQRLKIEKRREDAEELAGRLADLELEIPMTVGEENRIFGTVTTHQLSEALADRGIDVDRRDLTIHGDVRVLGTYTATIDVHPDVNAQLTFDVVPEEDEE